jgi:hypothetical protein
MIIMDLTKFFSDKLVLPVLTRIQLQAFDIRTFDYLLKQSKK